MIKRYEMWGYDLEIEESPTGSSVEYDDVVKIIKQAISSETKDEIVSRLIEGFGIDLNSEQSP